MPFVKIARQGTRRSHIELDGALDGSDLEDRHLRPGRRAQQCARYNDADQGQSHNESLDARGILVNRCSDTRRMHGPAFCLRSCRTSECPVTKQEGLLDSITPLKASRKSITCKNCPFLNLLLSITTKTDAFFRCGGIRHNSWPRDQAPYRTVACNRPQGMKPAQRAAKRCGSATNMTESGSSRN